VSRLFTRRLTIRPLERADLGVLTAWYADADLMRHIGDGRAFTAAETELALHRHLDFMARNGFGLMMAELQESGAPIGRVGFMEWDVDGAALLEIGWLIAPEHQGAGFATEAGAALRRHGFVALDRPVLVSVIQPQNTASIRVAEKLGAVRWRSWTTPGGADVVLYRYDRSELTSGDGD